MQASLSEETVNVCLFVMTEGVTDIQIAPVTLREMVTPTQERTSITETLVDNGGPQYYQSSDRDRGKQRLSQRPPTDTDNMQPVLMQPVHSKIRTMPPARTSTENRFDVQQLEMATNKYDKPVTEPNRISQVEYKVSSTASQPQYMEVPFKVTGMEKVEVVPVRHEAGGTTTQSITTEIPFGPREDTQKPESSEPKEPSIQKEVYEKQVKHLEFSFKEVERQECETISLKKADIYAQEKASPTTRKFEQKEESAEPSWKSRETSSTKVTDRLYKYQSATQQQVSKSQPEKKQQQPAALWRSYSADSGSKLKDKLNRFESGLSDTKADRMVQQKEGLLWEGQSMDSSSVRDKLSKFSDITTVSGTTSPNRRLSDTTSTKHDIWSPNRVSAAAESHERQAGTSSRGHSVSSQGSDSRSTPQKQVASTPPGRLHIYDNLLGEQSHKTQSARGMDNRKKSFDWTQSKDTEKSKYSLSTGRRELSLDEHKKAYESRLTQDDKPKYKSDIKVEPSKAGIKSPQERKKSFEVVNSEDATLKPPPPPQPPPPAPAVSVAAREHQQRQEENHWIEERKHSYSSVFSDSSYSTQKSEDVLERGGSSGGHHVRESSYDSMSSRDDEGIVEDVVVEPTADTLHRAQYNTTVTLERIGQSSTDPVTVTPPARDVSVTSPVVPPVRQVSVTSSVTPHDREVSVTSSLAPSARENSGTGTVVPTAQEIKVTSKVVPPTNRTSHIEEDALKLDLKGMEDEFFPPEFMKKLKSVNIDEGGQAIFCCQVDAEPLPVVVWEKYGKHLTGSPGRFKVGHCSFILIINAESSHQMVWSALYYHGESVTFQERGFLSSEILQIVTHNYSV